jgi:hypothetical protein
MQVKRCARSAVLVAASLVAFAAAADTAHHRIVKPSDLKWQDVGSLPPGAKGAIIEGHPDREGPVTLRVRLPANYRIAAHYHGTIERSTILSGTLHIGMGDTFDATKTTPMPAGTVLLMPPKMRHYVWTQEEVVFQLNVMGPWTVTYVNPADDPRAK